MDVNTYLIIELVVIFILIVDFVLYYNHLPKDRITDFMKAKKWLLLVVFALSCLYAFGHIAFDMLHHHPINMPLRIPYFILF